MPRILIDARSIADPYSGGVGRVARLWIASIIKAGPSCSSGRYSIFNIHNSNIPIEFLCVTTGIKPSNEAKKFCDELGIRYVHLRIPNKIWTLGCWLKIFALDRAAEKKVGKIDCTFLPNLGFVGKLSRPYELLLHDVSFAIEPRWFNWRRRLWHTILPVVQLIRGAEKLHCVSKRTRDDAIRLFAADAGRCRVFKFDPTLKQSEPTRPPWLPECAKRYALLLGGADPRKNIQTALHALTQYNLNHPEDKIVPVVLGGRVPGKHKDYVPCIRPTEQVTDAELCYLYKNAWVFLYPSWYEGYGLPLREAKSFNTPCMSSTTGALPETAPQDTLFCNPAKPHEWLAGLETLDLIRN